MNKIITTIVALVALAFSASAQTVNTNNETLFNKNEVGLVLQGDYVTKGNHKWGAALGARAFPLNKYAGLEATAGFRDVDSGPVIDDVNLSGVLRLPLETYRISLQAVGGARYDLDEKDYQWSVGPRVGYRFNSKVEFFAGYRYSFARQNLLARREFPFGVNFNF